jgi:acyl-CoA synthetase (AMP-forming)/AMP-acid ligase II
LNALDPAAPSRARATLEAFGLDALLSGAARLRAARAALSWSGDGATRGSLSFGEWDRAASVVAGALAACGLEPGERVLILGAADPATLELIFGAARAGLDVALAPIGDRPDWIAERARAVAAVALLAPGAVGAARPSADLALAAARCDTLRLAAIWGATDAPHDGVLALHEVEPAPLGRRETKGALFTFADDPARPQRHRQDRLAAAAFDLMHRARLGAARPIVTTIAPVRHAGLVAGPLAALAAGATLHLHAPFAFERLRAALVETGPAFLIAPAAIGAAMAERLGPDALCGLGLLTDAPDAPAATVRAPAPPIVDLWRWGESALAASPRDAQGRPDPGPTQPHAFPLDDDVVAAIEWRRSEDGGWELRGAACAHGDVWARP